MSVASFVPATTSPIPDVPRNRYGNPMILVDGKPKQYLRASKLGETLTDDFRLGQWRKRQTALGMAIRPDLLTAVSAATGDDERLNALCEEAMQAAGSTAAATMGTALHQLAEVVDTGGKLTPHVPAAARARIGNYTDTIRGAKLSTVEAELFVVADEVRTAGTLDRLYLTPSGRVLIGDLKTGKIADKDGRMYQEQAVKIAVQLAVYANGSRYDPATGARTPLHPDLDLTRGIVVHLPAEGAVCTLFEVDLVTGWALARLAREVRDSRTTKGLASARYSREQS